MLAVAGAGLYSAGALRGLSAIQGNAVSFLVLIGPVTVVMARLESGAREATIGKRGRRLRVVDARTESGVSFGRALLRNAVKIALPWELGHTVAYGLFGSSPGASVPGWLVAVTVAAYMLPIAYVVTLFVGHGRTPYDWLSGTVVVRDDAPVAGSAGGSSSLDRDRPAEGH